jgi:hypothetical protein
MFMWSGSPLSAGETTPHRMMNKTHTAPIQILLSADEFFFYL